VRSFAAAANISKDMARRWFRAASIAPHRSRSFKLSNDPAFVETVGDITGRCLNPPDHAIVLCADEKNQIQAPERTQALFSMGLGCSEGVTHDYVRHGTTTLFAALDVANGQVISRVRTQHRHQEFLDFLRQIDRQTPPELDLHWVVDNDTTHKHAKVKVWLARHSAQLLRERARAQTSSDSFNATAPTQPRSNGWLPLKQFCSRWSASRNVFLRQDTRERSHLQPFLA
jgi:putative transposase